MKKEILLFITLAGLLSVSNAQRVRGTIRNANTLPVANEVVVSIKPTVAFNAQISNLIVSVQIPTSVGPRPAITVTNLQPGLFATWTQLDMDQGDGFYTWGFNCVAPGASNTDGATWSTAELDVLRIGFVGNPGTPFITRLCHYLDGGNGLYAIFYVETTLAAVNGGILSDWGSLFYGTAASNGPVAAGNIGVANAQYSFTTAPDVILPVRFLGFSASKRDNNAILNWQIENESAITDRYEIERSLNGTDFKKMATVQAKNNGNSSNSYDLTDFNLSSVRKAGIFYYRIRQVDKDTRFVYSDIKSVRLNSRGIAIGVFPNPIREFANVTIDLEQDDRATITINDAAGKQIQNTQMQLFKGPNIKKINMRTLAAGSYLLKIQTATEIITIPVVKTN